MGNAIIHKFSTLNHLYDVAMELLKLMEEQWLFYLFVLFIFFQK